MVFKTFVTLSTNLFSFIFTPLNGNVTSLSGGIEANIVERT